MKVGIIGIGGLGHLGLQFASKLGGEVYAISSSPSKTEESKKLGAKGLINSRDPEAMKQYAGKLDVILATGNAPGQEWEPYMNLLKFSGKLVLVGIPEEQIKFFPFALIKGQRSFEGSLIGGRNQVREMLEFAAKHNVRPMIQKLPMSKCNEGVQMIRDGKPRYRVVLEN
jgi:alcohol dehydrogenase (NADP+)